LIGGKLVAEVFERKVGAFFGERVSMVNSLWIIYE